MSGIGSEVPSVDPKDAVVIDLEAFDDFNTDADYSSSVPETSPFQSDSEIPDPDGFVFPVAKTADGSKGQGLEAAMAAQFQQRVKDDVTDLLWRTGKEKAEAAFALYAKIDVLRPYFDVEPIQVRNRLLASYVPVWPTAKKQPSIPGDLYGPCMVIFTLVAVLLFQMKASSHSVQDGSLMGTALLVCFLYWLGSSCLLLAATHLFETRLRLLQILSLTGYALSSHCAVIFLTTLYHGSSHAPFYVLWLAFSGPTALRLTAVFWSRTRDPHRRLLVAVTPAVTHLLFLLYLHFAFHENVVHLEEALDRMPREI